MASDVLRSLTNLSIVVFVLCSMLSMGFNLRISQIQIAGANRRLVLGVLVANFLIVPAIAFVLTQLIPVNPALTTGLFLLAAGSGAPVLPKLVQIARGNLALATGLMVMLMATTVLVLPVVLPLLIGSSVTISRWDLAKPLVFAMLFPLALGLALRLWFPDLARVSWPVTNKVANAAFALALMGLLIINREEAARVLRTSAFLAAALFVTGSFLAGYLLAGRNPDHQLVAAFATGQRDISAALLLATTNFTRQPGVNVMVVVVGLLGLIGLTAAAAAFRFLGSAGRETLPEPGASDGT